MNTEPQQPQRPTSAAPAHSKVRSIAALVLTANAFKASQFLHERLKNARITSRFTNCVDGVFCVRLVSGLADFEAKGESTDSEEDALAQATQSFANWEHQQTVAKAGDAVDLAAPWL